MELKEYVAPALKWWWLILVATLIAGASSYLATRQQPPQYRSTATLVVGSSITDLNPTSGDIYLTQQLASFYVNMAYRPTLQQDVRENLGLAWLPEIYVRNVNNLIDIIVTDTNPQRAQAVAAEIAQQLILRSPAAQQQEQERTDFINRQLSNYEAAILEAQAEIEAKQAELATLISAREIAAMQTEIASLQASLEQLEGNYTRLISGTQRGAVNSINIVEPATLPTGPINASNRMTIVAAAAIGFVLAATAAYLLEYLDDSVKTPQQVTRLTGLPVLSGIAKTGKGETLVTITTPRAPVSEAYRILRTGIQYSSVDKPSRVILLASATPDEGKSTTAANLAVVIAQAGSRVLLIDADLRRPTLHTFFDVPNRRGLTSLLIESDMEHADESVEVLTRSMVHETAVADLHLLSSGPVPPNPSELLGSAKMKALLTALVHQYDFLILDSPPVLTVTDAAILSTQVDGTLLVVRANKTRRNLMKQATAKLQEVNANLLGSVLNAIPAGSEGYRSYYYYQDDSYYRDSSTEPPHKNGDR
jgi:polysaccharide biosynthesis transport protein